jgi:putative Mg2+ transporter-C (MgtC) family protein
MNHALSAEDWQELTFRVLLALLAGGVVGLNREIHRKSAGLRTHILVSVGVALFVMVALILAPQNADAVSRVIQGVTAGIGFVGAGEILREPTSVARGKGKPKVRGLTSAAAIWVAAALGAVAGCGMWKLLTIGTVTTFIVLSVVLKLERFTHREPPTAEEPDEDEDDEEDAPTDTGRS